jgi:hypothetical protein
MSLASWNFLISSSEIFFSGKPSLIHKTFMAVSQSGTLIDHLLKFTLENFSGLSVSTKLAIDNSENGI